MKNLGKRMKTRRESLGMSLSELSQRVGVSSSAISQIENSKSFPSILTLKQIAVNLHTTVSELIGEHEAWSSEPLVRYSDRKFVQRNNSGASLFQLTNHYENKQMDVHLIIFPEGSNSEELLKTHHGQTYIFIIKGELEITMDNDTFVLKKNDSLYFNAHVSQSAVNRLHRETHLLIVNTPPVS